MCTKELHENLFLFSHVFHHHRCDETLYWTCIKLSTMKTFVKKLHKCLSNARVHLSEREIIALLVKHSSTLSELPIDVFVDILKLMSAKELKAVCTANKKLNEKCKDPKAKKVIKKEKKWREIVADIVDTYRDVDMEDLYPPLAEEITEIMMDSHEDTRLWINTIVSVYDKKNLLKRIKERLYPVDKYIDFSMYEAMDVESLAVLYYSIVLRTEDEMWDAFFPEVRTRVLQHMLNSLSQTDRGKWVHQWNLRAKWRL